MATERLGRNALCGCGSGRKFKRCCGSGAPADCAAQERAQFNLALEAQRLGRTDEALDHYRRALALNPRNVDALMNQSNVLSDMGRHDEAVAVLRHAMVLAPDMGGLHLNMAAVLQAANRLDEAIASCRRAVAALPDLSAASISLATMLRLAGDPDGAEQALAQAAAVDPTNEAVHAAHGAALAAVGRPGESAQAYRRALAKQPGNAAWRSSLIGAMLYLPEVDADALQMEMDAFDRAVIATTEAGGPMTALSPPSRPAGAGVRRPRLGYVSADLREHSVAYFIEPVLAMHDRARVEVYCYSCAAEEDYVTRRIRSHELHWRACAQLDDRQLAQQISRDGIDILVDLSGHTTGGRPGVFALRPAPIQITWLGYPGATGLRAMDAIIGDALVEPTADAVIRLAPTFSCYLPPANAPDVAPAPHLRNGHITMGCFNNLGKVSDSTVAVWSKLLRELPNAVLLLKHRALGAGRAQAWVRERFGRHGIDERQLQLRPRDAGIESHLTNYAMIDVALDPFPYCGVTTTCEALWMGVPVVSLVGENFASRTGLSILSAIGHADWAATTEDDYVEKAMALCNAPDRLVEIRAGLRASIAASPLVDARAFTRALEDALIDRWQQHGRVDASSVQGAAVRPAQIPLPI